MRLGGRDNVRDKSERLVGEEGDAENVSQKVEISNFLDSFKKGANTASHGPSMRTIFKEMLKGWA